MHFSTSADIIYWYWVALNIFIFVNLPVETKTFFFVQMYEVTTFLKTQLFFLFKKDKN